ncbi:MAG: LPXTG cell wall anchor domain-containing protein [Treponema sp.]|nr:LPXTG cell wall anchor domain-containing protein [Treponema sp.]
MSPTDIVVLAGLAAITVFVIVWIIRRKKKGKRSCCS